MIDSFDLYTSQNRNLGEIFAFNYFSLLYVISTILGITSLADKHAKILGRGIQSTLVMREQMIIGSSVLQHCQNNSKENFHSINLDWPGDDTGVKLLTIADIEAKFLVDFKNDLEKHRNTLESYGEI